MPVVYLVLSAILYLVYHKPMVLGTGGGWAIVTAFAAAGGLICFFYALSKGDASVVVPTTSAYPVIALAGGADLPLGEHHRAEADRHGARDRGRGRDQPCAPRSAVREQRLSIWRAARRLRAARGATRRPAARDDSSTRSSKMSGRL